MKNYFKGKADVGTSDSKLELMNYTPTMTELKEQARIVVFVTGLESGRKI